MTVASILSEKGREVVTTSPDTRLAQIVETLAARGIGAMVVVEGDGTVCGIISERDIVREVADHGVSVLDEPVSACMTRKVVSCGENDTIHHVMTVMTRHRFRHMPVMEDNIMIGFISIGDVVAARLSELQAEKDALTGMIMGN